MKLNNEIIAKKYLAAYVAATMSVITLAGCGAANQNENTPAAAETEADSDIETDMSISGNEEPEIGRSQDYLNEPINSIEERVGKNKFESYDEIINALQNGEGYAYIKVKGYDDDVLAVTTYTYDDLLGHMASTECTLYTIKPDGTVNADTLLSSGGTATPVTIDKEGIVYTASHVTVDKFCYGADIPSGVGMVCVGQVMGENIQENGEPTSVFGSYRTSNSVSTDDNLVTVDENDIEFYNQMFDDYNHSEPINFTVVSFGLKDYEGFYSVTGTEELEGYEVSYTYGYQLNGDGTGVCYGQDVVDFTWNETELHFADRTADYEMAPDKLTVDGETYDKIKGRLITPNPYDVDIDHIEDGEYYAGIDEAGLSEKDNTLSINTEIYTEDTYDIADIDSMGEGDVIYIKNSLIPVYSIANSAAGILEVNNGIEYGGSALRAIDDANCYVYAGMDLEGSYTRHGFIELKVSEDLKLIDNYDPAEEKCYTGNEAVMELKNIVKDSPLSCYNCKVTIEKGIITEINRMYIP